MADQTKMGVTMIHYLHAYIRIRVYKSFVCIPWCLPDVLSACHGFLSEWRPIWLTDVLSAWRHMSLSVRHQPSGRCPILATTSCVSVCQAPAEWSVSYPSHHPGKNPVRVSSTLDFHLPATMLEQGRGSATVHCLAKQSLSGYHQQAAITLHQDSQSLLWLFSAGQLHDADGSGSSQQVSCMTALLWLFSAGQFHGDDSSGSSWQASCMMVTALALVWI